MVVLFFVASPFSYSSRSPHTETEKSASQNVRGGWWWSCGLSTGTYGTRQAPVHAIWGGKNFLGPPFQIGDCLLLTHLLLSIGTTWHVYRR